MQTGFDKYPYDGFLDMRREYAFHCLHGQSFSQSLKTKLYETI